jgi:hypothetical protein
MTLLVDGVWRTETYVVGGAEQAIDGVLFLTSGRWATLYFVPGEQGPWGSAEAGRYRHDGDRLVFLHQLVFQGGGGRPVHIDQQAGREEECEVALEHDRLTIRFPSGNHLHLRRLAG